jgi:hypothetical protein
MEKEVVRTRIWKKVVERKEMYETTHKELLQPGRDKRSSKKSKRNNCEKMEGSGIFFVNRAVQKEKYIRSKSKTAMLSLKKINSDERGEVVSIQARCSKGKYFKSGPEFRLPRLRASYGFLQCLQLNDRTVSLTFMGSCNVIYFYSKIN